MIAVVRRGDSPFVASTVAELRALSGNAAMDSLASELARGLRAQADAARGSSADALRLLETFEPAGWYERSFVPPFFAGAMERFLRADLFPRAGRAEESLDWYQGLIENSTRELVFLGRCLLRMSAILESLGRGQEAVPLLDRFLELWSDADPSFAPLVTEARERRGRLVS